MMIFLLSIYILNILIQIVIFPFIGVWLPLYSILLLPCYLMLYFSVRDININQRISFTYLFILTLMIICEISKATPYSITIYIIIFIEHLYLQGVLGACLLYTKKESYPYLLPVSILIYIANLYILYTLEPQFLR